MTTPAASEPSRVGVETGYNPLGWIISIKVFGRLHSTESAPDSPGRDNFYLVKINHFSWTLSIDDNRL